MGPPRTQWPEDPLCEAGSSSWASEVEQDTGTRLARNRQLCPCMTRSKVLGGSGETAGSLGCCEAPSTELDSVLKTTGNRGKFSDISILFVFAYLLFFKVLGLRKKSFSHQESKFLQLLQVFLMFVDVCGCFIICNNWELEDTRGNVLAQEMNQERN